MGFLQACESISERQVLSGQIGAMGAVMQHQQRQRIGKVPRESIRDLRAV